MMSTSFQGTWHKVGMYVRGIRDCEMLHEANDVCLKRDGSAKGKWKKKDREGWHACKNKAKWRRQKQAVVGKEDL